MYCATIFSAGVLAFLLHDIIVPCSHPTMNFVGYKTEIETYDIHFHVNELIILLIKVNCMASELSAPFKQICIFCALKLINLKWIK
jgi:hypothetical protein